MEIYITAGKIGICPAIVEQLCLFDSFDPLRVTHLKFVADVGRINRIARNWASFTVTNNFFYRTYAKKVIVLSHLPLLAELFETPCVLNSFLLSPSTRRRCHSCASILVSFVRRSLFNYIIHVVFHLIRIQKELPSSNSTTMFLCPSPQYMPTPDMKGSARMFELYSRLPYLYVAPQY